MCVAAEASIVRGTWSEHVATKPPHPRTHAGHPHTIYFFSPPLPLEIGMPQRCRQYLEVRAGWQ